MTEPTVTIPESYDFNEHYTPLYVMNQGTSPTCWYHQMAAHCSAFRRMYDNKEITYDPHGYTFEQVDEGCGKLFHMPDGDIHMFDASGCNPKYFGDRGGQTPENLKRAIYLNGIVEFSVASQDPWFNHCFYKQSMPVLHPDTTVPHDVDHSVLAAGFTPDGVLIQNSWSLSFGLNGRAVLAWDFIDHYGCFATVDQYVPHPVDGLILPAPHVKPTPPPQPAPQPAKEDDLFLIQKTGDRSVFSVTGGHLDRVPNPTVVAALTAQGIKIHTIPVSNPLWKLPVIPTH